jgi:hypothetical protein
MVIGIIVAAVIVLCGVGAVIAAVSGGGSSSGTISASSAGNGGGKKTTVGLNQPARDGKFEFTVTNIKYGVAKVGDQFLDKTAQGQFVEVSVTVKNIGDQPRTFAGFNQKAFGAGGVTYSDDTEAEIYANTADQTFLNDINPGNSVQGVIIFDIPKGAKLTKLELHDSMLSGGVAVTVG